MEELAIFGGEPIRKDPIYYGRQCIEQDDIDAVADTLLIIFFYLGRLV